MESGEDIMTTFDFQSVLPDNNFKCDTMLPNHMQCPRKVTRILNNQTLCEGHFQVQLQTYNEQVRLEEIKTEVPPETVQ